MVKQEADLGCALNCGGRVYCVVSGHTGSRLDTAVIQ